MSTKIYNGYRIPNYDLLDLQNFCFVLKQNITEINKKLILKKIMRDAVFAADLFSHSLRQAPTHGIFSEIWDTFREKTNNVKKNNYREPWYDYSCNISIIPTSERSHLMLVYTEVDEITQFIRNFANVEDFSYFDNTDKPDNISDEQWEIRERWWDKFFFKKGSCALDVGFGFDLYPIGNYQDVFMDEIFPSNEKIQSNWDVLSKYLPTPEKRARLLADDYLNEHCKDTKRFPAGTPTNEIIHFIMSDEAAQFTKNKAEELIPNLPKVTPKYLSIGEKNDN